jgi:hypothetical protein
MRHEDKVIVLGGALAAVLLVNFPANAQANRPPDRAQAAIAKGQGQTASEEMASALDCPRPLDAKEAKVVDFDTVSSVARLAVSLGSGRFKLVTIKAGDKPEDPRPLTPIIEAARIMQGKLQFYSPNLTADPASAPSEFLIMTEMGGGYVCWATPSALMKEGAYPIAAVARSPVVPAAARPNASPAAIAPGTADGADQPARAGRTITRQRAPATLVRDGDVTRDAAPQ